MQGNERAWNYMPWRKFIKNTYKGVEGDVTSPFIIVAVIREEV